MNLRGDVNKCMEIARRQKLVGSSLECQVSCQRACLGGVSYLLDRLMRHLPQVRIHTEDSSMAALLADFCGDPELAWPPSRSNAVDELRFVLIASKVDVVSTKEDAAEGCGDCFIDAEASESGCSIGVTRTEGIKCERCWM